MDALREKINKEIDEKISLIDIGDLINDPNEYLAALVESVKEDIIDQRVEEAMNLGEKFAKDIEKKDEIIVDDSSNPRKNNELVDG
jgi:hypothetical protein